MNKGICGHMIKARATQVGMDAIHPSSSHHSLLRHHHKYPSVSRHLPISPYVINDRVRTAVGIQTRRSFRFDVVLDAETAILAFVEGIKSIRNA